MLSLDTRWKTILAAGLILLLISGFNLYQTITLQSSHLEEMISLEEKAQNVLARNIEKRTREYYVNRINSFTHTRKDILQAFAQRDREKLLALCQPIYESLKKENSSFFIFHFFLPDNTTFLRVHIPDFHGDDLTDIRPIVKEVNTTHTQVNGFEVGRMGIFYRVTQPVFVNEEYIGAFEFGIKIDELLTTLGDNFSDEIALLIDENTFKKATLLTATKTITCGSNVLLTQGNNFFTQIASDFNFDCDHQSARVELNGHTFHVSNDLTVDDYSGKPIGKVIIAMDITDQIQKFRQLIRLSIITTSILFLVAIFFLHISIGKLLNKIFTLNVSLKEINDNLESTIRQRTAELESEIHEREQAFKTLEDAIHQRHEIELQLEKEAIKSVKLESVGVLAGGIAHDFNNILAAILGNINLAAMITGPDHEIHEMLQTAEKATIRARDLTSQLLTFARGGSPVKLTSSILEVVEDAAQLTTSGYEIKYTYDQDTEIWPVEIDPVQISQVFQNIISNSCQAMPAGGVITISCTNIDSAASTSLSLPENNYVQVSISDSGCGIDEKHISKIFDPYFSTKERDSQRGSGLGLAIVHSIIMQHDGLIKAESVKGEGTTFSVFLPARPDLIGSHKQKDTNPPVLDGEGKILIMDDEQIVLDVAKMMLTHMGYDVTTTKDGEEMLKLYQQNMETDEGFSVVIMDLSIPGGMGGEQAIKELLKMNPDAKSIVSSGYSNDPIMANYKEYGFVGVLKKPFQVEELWRALRQATRKLELNNSHFKI